MENTFFEEIAASLLNVKVAKCDLQPMLSELLVSELLKDNYQKLRKTSSSMWNNF